MLFLLAAMLIPAVVCLAALALLWWAWRESPQSRRSAPLPTIFLLLAAVQALVLAVVLGWLAWDWTQSIPQWYSDLTSGSVGFQAANKTAEYYGLYAGILAFVGFFVLLRRGYVSASRNPELRSALPRLALLGLIPAAVALGQSLRIPNLQAILMAAAVAVVLALFVQLMVGIWVQRRAISRSAAFEAGAKLALCVVFLALSDVGLRIALSRFGFLSYLPGSGAFILLLTFSALVAVRRRRGTTEDALDLGLVVAQSGLPLLLTVLASPPVMFRNGSVGYLTYRPTLAALVAVGIAASYFDLYRRYHKHSGTRARTADLVSPLAMVAILVFARSTPLSWPSIAPDDFHVGEIYLPWWLFKDHGYLPFVDYQPSRGLTNYVPGFLAWLFRGGTFENVSATANIHTAIYVVAVFFVLRAVVGGLPAFLVALSLFYDLASLGGALLFDLAALTIVWKYAAGHRPARAWLLWAVLILLAVLNSAAEGGLLAVSTLPLAVWLLCQAYRQDRRELTIAGGLLLLAALVLALTTPAPRMAVALLRYLLEQSAINDVAHAITWQYPLDILSGRVTAGPAWQLLRYSWLLLIVPIAYRLVHNNGRERPDVDRYFLVSLLFFCVLLTPRVAGRVDAEAFSRPWLASISLVLWILPIVLLAGLRDPIRHATLLLGIAAVFGLLGSQQATLQTAWNAAGHVIYEPVDLVSGPARGIANVGTAVVMDPKLVDRQKTIRRVLNVLLDPSETFYDATSHSADYGYQGRPPPVADVASYNTVSEGQQQRAIAALEKRKIPIALVQAENMDFDGGPLSLRAYAIYSYLLSNYAPFEDRYAQVWMIRNEDVRRLNRTIYRVPSPDDALALLMRSFWQKDLAALPRAWGGSFKTISPRLQLQEDLLARGPFLDMQDLQTTGTGELQVVGPRPRVTLSVPVATGEELLYLEMQPALGTGTFEVLWTNELVPAFRQGDSFTFKAGSAAYLVPLSAAPSWKLAAGPAQLRIDLPETVRGNVRFIRVLLYHRKVGW